MISKATKSSRPAPALPLLLSLLVLLMNPALLLTRAFSQLKVRRVSFIPTISLPVTHQGSRSQADRILDTRIWKSSRSRSALAVARIDIAAVKPATRPYRLVIVESPSKCNTISNILNQYVKDNGLEYDFVVTASFGHVRNLPKSGGKNETVVGVDVHNRYQPKYEILPGKEGLVRDLQSLATDAQQVILAMDEDREGEAIAWHTAELLTKDTPQVRVTFTEITPKAILAAIEQPRGLDMNLVEAQETRRVLDRLAGYTLSPLLWKKIAPGLSAGRVQSVGMALVVQRERERLVFVSANYWDLAATFDGNVTATLVQVNGQTIACGADFNDAGELTSPSKVHVDQQHAEAILAAMANGELNVWLQNPNESKWSVSSIKSRERSQNSPMPFITSTLQQESVRKVGLSVSQTMSCAQKLYEAGYISYMRTDSTHLSEDAHTAVAGMIASSYGEELIAPQRKSKKSKNAQESHEAIRPAIQPNGGFLAPSELGDLNGAEKDLYELIYQRTIASRMTPQRLNSTSMEIEGASPDGKTKLLFRVTGSVVIDPGYTLAYGRSNDGDQLLPSWLEGESVMCQDLSSVSHETKPPPRYTEASFVKELESLGVGRPSTYAGTVQILRDRAYVGTPVKADGSGSSKQKKSRTGSSISAQRAAGGEDFTGGGRGPLVPSLSAFVVTSLMENHLTTYVDPSFTAGLEDKLDMIARGEEGANRVSYLDEFYAGDEGLAAKVQRIDESVDSDNARRANLPGLFTNEEGDAKGDIALMIGPWGPYIQRMNSNTTAKPVTAQLPAGMASDLTTITRQSLATLLESREKDGVLLGHHPEDEREIRLKVGRYGAYLQWGKQGDEDTTNHSLPRHIGSMRNLDFSAMNDPEEGATSLSAMIGLSFEEAVLYVGLPRTICTLNELPIIAAIGPYGPYLKYNETFMSLNKGDGEVLDIDAIEAEKLVIERIIEKKSVKGRDVIAELGDKEGSMVKVKNGRFGVYINWKRVNAKLPNEYDENPERVPLEEAWSLIQEKEASGTGKASAKSRKAKAPKGQANSGINLPPAPKRSKSAYLLFCDEKRPEVSTTVKKLGDVSKELAKLWALTADVPDARQPYIQMAAEEKAKYATRKLEWQNECQILIDTAAVTGGGATDVLSKTKRSSSSVKKVPHGKKSGIAPAGTPKPKRPKSSYIFFCADQRAEVSENVKSLGEISKELARRWAEAKSTDTHKRFEEMAAVDKHRYELELQKLSSISDLNASKGSGVKQSPRVVPLLKKKRARSAYMIFCGEHRSTIVDDDGVKLPFGETAKKLAQMWRECNEETREKFEAEARKEKDDFMAERY